MTPKQQTDALEVTDINEEIRLLLRDLKFAALDALLLRIRHGDIDTADLVRLCLELR